MIDLALLNKPINQEMYGKTEEPRRIVLRQDQSPGDILTFTRAVADLKAAYPHFQIDVDTPCPQIFENNPHLTPLNKFEAGVEYHSIRYDTINESGWRGHHFADAFRMDVESKLGVPVPSQGIRPQLFLSEDEQSWFHLPHCEWGYDGDFWTLNAGFKSDNLLKAYHRWPEFVALFNEHFQGDVRLVQMGHSSHNHVPIPGAFNGIGHVDDLRKLIRLVYWSQGTIGPISCQMVMSQAFQQPYVAVGAGKEGPRWQGTNQGTFLDTVGNLTCCVHDGCWKGGQMGECADLIGGVPRCFTLIESEDILKAVCRYYDGGRLQLPEKEAVAE